MRALSFGSGRSLQVATMLGLVCGTIPAVHAQGAEQIAVPLMAVNHDQPVQTWHVQGRVYMLVGAGGNITAQIGDEAVVLVNAGRQDMSPGVIAAVRRLSNKPIEFIIDTSADPDDVGGTEAVAKLGFANTGQPGEPPGAGVVAQLKTLDRLSSQPVNGAEIPTDSFDDQWSFFNNEAVIIRHAPAAHTDGDSYVFFRRSDVISTGDIFNTDLYPVIDAQHGGSIDGILDALNDIIYTMVPEQNEEGGTYVIPGHGRVCDRTEIVNYRDALTIIRGRIAYYVSRGMSLPQILAAKPTLDYDGIYGSDTGPWTTSMFIEAVYKDVLAQSHGRHKPNY
jgi:glyoxylase-like metal-dependent hydrolase (beta-lactamase superfamily II)